MKTRSSDTAGARKLGCGHERRREIIDVIEPDARLCWFCSVAGIRERWTSGDARWQVLVAV